jgi:hypothetical protein
MQAQDRTRTAAAVVFDSSLEGIAQVLALAMAVGLHSKQEIRLTSLSIGRNNLKVASFADLISRFYGPSLSIGMSEKGTAETSVLPMMTTVLSKQTSEGKPTYARTVERFNDTADPLALIRNALTAQQDQNTVVVLAGSPLNLLGLLALPNSRQLIQQKVRTLVIAGGPDPKLQLPDSKLIDEWPSPIVVVGDEVGQGAPFPATSIEQDFAWATNHPLVDAYRAAGTMPYDVASTAMAALLYAAHPNQNYFAVSGTGKQQKLALDSMQKDRVIQAYRQVLSAKPPEPRRGRGGNE